MSRLDSAVEFASNPDPRCACVLLLDTSPSMLGKPITSLNDGLHTFRNDIKEDALAARRCEIAIVTFGGTPKTVRDFEVAGNFKPPTLSAGGDGTQMGAGINVAVDLVERRKDEYKRNGILYYRPWIFMITDGEPTDEWSNAAARIKEQETANGLTFFAVGVEDADMETLACISVRPPLSLDGLAFRDMFLWLSASQKKVSGSKPGEKTSLPPVDWGSV